MSQTNALPSRSIGQILVETFRVCGRNLGRVLIIGAGVWIVLDLIVPPLDLPVFQREDMPDALFDQLKPPLLYTWIYRVLRHLLLVPLVSGALVHAVSASCVGSDVAIGRAYRSAGARAGALIGAHLWVQGVAFGILLLAMGISFGMWAVPVASGWQALGSMLIMFAAFPVMYYYLIRWAFILPVVLLEGLGPREALSRSAELSEGNRGRILWVMVVSVGISWGGRALLSIVSEVGGSIAGSVLGILYTVGITLLYFDLRVRKEGYRLAELSTELGLDGGERREGCTT